MYRNWCQPKLLHPKRITKMSSNNYRNYLWWTALCFFYVYVYYVGDNNLTGQTFRRKVLIHIDLHVAINQTEPQQSSKLFMMEAKVQLSAMVLDLCSCLLRRWPMVDNTSRSGRMLIHVDLQFTMHQNEPQQSKLFVKATLEFSSMVLCLRLLRRWPIVENILTGHTSRGSSSYTWTCVLLCTKMSHSNQNYV